jgi:hypothetical protein
MEQGGRLAAKAKVTDEILDKCKPIAAPHRLHPPTRGTRGRMRTMLELGATPARATSWWTDVLPHFR